jgi:hypothetical protein
VPSEGISLMIVRLHHVYPEVGFLESIKGGTDPHVWSLTHVLLPELLYRSHAAEVRKCPSYLKSIEAFSTIRHDQVSKVFSKVIGDADSMPE